MGISPAGITYHPEVGTALQYRLRSAAIPLEDMPKIDQKPIEPHTDFASVWEKIEFSKQDNTRASVVFGVVLSSSQLEFKQIISYLERPELSVRVVDKVIDLAEGGYLLKTKDELVTDLEQVHDSYISIMKDQADSKSTEETDSLDVLGAVLKKNNDNLKKGE